MKARFVGAALTLVLVATSAFGVGLVAASPPGSITWTVDHQKKTITARVRIQLYSGCSGNPYGPATDQARACSGATSDISQLLADKISSQVDRVWNKGYHFRCYRLIVLVDITFAPDQGHLDPDRLGVRIDPSAIHIRSWVDAPFNPTQKWNSDNPADRVDPQNGTDDETTWTEGAQGSASQTYAHEIGHMLGLEDTYTWSRDANGAITYKDIPGAPLDLMNGHGGIDQTTIDRLIKRNSDRLSDTSGESVDLKDLVCEPEFLAFYEGSQNEYVASSIMDSAPRCPLPVTTSSTTQDLKIAKSPGVAIRAVEATGTALGYVFVPAFDPIVAANGLSGGRGSGAVGMFDVPITVQVTRFFEQPASGDVPVPKDLHDDVCPGGDSGGSPPPKDCGSRTFPAWIAVSATGTQVWPAASSLPALLGSLGYSSGRLDRLYRNCRGPTPWPGSFADGQGVVKHFGHLPDLATLTKVAEDWWNDGKPGKIELNGDADLDRSRVGDYEKDNYVWYVTLCPVNEAGQPPVGCP